MRTLDVCSRTTMYVGIITTLNMIVFLFNISTPMLPRNYDNARKPWLIKSLLVLNYFQRH
jgi:hypothetical protein